MNDLAKALVEALEKFFEGPGSIVEKKDAFIAAIAGKDGDEYDTIISLLETMEEDEKDELEAEEEEIGE